MSVDLCHSAHVVLPPIISNEKDRRFLNELTTFVDEELGAVDSTNPDQRYIIYRSAFDKVIEHVHAYKPLLTSVKAEYEECIDTILRGKQEAFYLNGKLKAMASEASTMRNYRKRCDELTDRLNIVRGNNEILQDELHQLRAARLPDLQETDSESEHSGQAKSPKPADTKLIPGLTIEESTDADLLEKELAQLQRRLRQLQVSRHIQYKPKSESEKLKVKLDEKERLKEQYAREEKVLKMRLAKLKVALEAAKLYNELAGPYTQESIGDLIVDSLRRHKRGDSLDEVLKMARSLSSHQTSDTSLFEEDDPAKERDADAVMDYIHKFNQLFDDRQYSAAAVHAANSPRGVLRTMMNLQKFKDASPVAPSDAPPLLQFVCSVMASVRAVKVIPGDDMAEECVRCALENGKLDLLQHWVAHQLFNPREELGDLLRAHCECNQTCVCGCQAMAQCMYVQTQCTMKAMECMLKQGRVKQAFQFGNSLGHCLDQETCLHLLHEYGSSELARLMLFPVGGAKLPVGVACLALIEKGMEREGCDLLEEVVREEEGVELINDELSANDLSEEDWQTIAQKCRHNGHDDVSNHLMAAITVRSAVRTAVILLRGSGV